MPEYISILRQSSVASIYFLLALVLVYSIIKGRIKDKELAILFYVWLPIAVITQITMTYVRTHMEHSNLYVMNIYLMIEFIILLYVLIKIREKSSSTTTNYRLWLAILIFGILLHFLDDIDKIHNSAMLYCTVIYFHLTVSFIDLNKIDEMIKDPRSIVHLAIFTKAFGYSYFLIYQIDYQFPLAIYSGLNLLVQVLFGISFIMYMKRR